MQETAYSTSRRRPFAEARSRARILAGLLLAGIALPRDLARPRALERSQGEDGARRGDGATRLARRGRKLDAALEGVAALRARALDPAHEPALPLLGRPMCPRLGSDTPLRALLDAVVTDCRGGVERVGDVLAGQILDEAGVERVPDPEPCVAVRLQLDANLSALRARVAVGARRGRRSRSWT